MVAVQVNNIEIPTYVPYPADKNPIFFEKRNVQGACGKVFPMAFCDRLEKEFRPVPYEQIAMENEYIDIALLPSMGGRVYSALDKTNGYDFIYRNRHMKPQRIGLCGPWVSGGIEFNWPQHHRPTTYMPMPYTIEKHGDGSVTTWMGEVEPLNRTKGMVGITMYPGKSYMRAKIRLFNRTPHPQSFLWWANLAVAVNDQYRAVFPDDIHWSSDHAWALTTEFPILKGMYKSFDFGSGVDVRNFKDMPLQTSFFVYNSKYDFLSGYDFGKDSGVVHIANRHIATGKKMFTWGVSDFSRVWYENLSDDDGPYIELMTGAYSCNQPDFSWMMPHEYKTAEQYWYPVREIGEVKNATLGGAIGFELRGDRASIAFNATERHAGARAVLTHGDAVVLDTRFDIAPDKPYRRDDIAVPADAPHTFHVALYGADGKLLVDYRPDKPAPVTIPPALTPAPKPKEVDTVENLYLHALHLWQYRHPYLSPVDYLREALGREPSDIRCNTLMGKILLDQGDFSAAEACFEKACAHSTMRNPNPYDTEPYYQLGVTQRLMGKTDDAYRNLYKSVWGYAWKSAGYCLLAEMDCRRGDYATALSHVEEALMAGGANFAAMRVRASILRVTGNLEAARAAIDELLAKDPLDTAAMFEKARILMACGADDAASTALAECAAHLQSDPENHLDIALAYGQMGLYGDAIDVLRLYADRIPADAVSPVVYYYLADYARQSGNALLGHQYAALAKAASVEGCFHSRLESIRVLRNAAALDVQDANAPYLLGNIYYGKDMFEEAIRCYELSVQRGAAFPTVYRNLAIGYFDKQGKKDEAGELIRKAFAMDPSDHRVFFELMQYCRNTGMPVKERLALLDAHSHLIDMRDDLTLLAVSTCLEAKQYERAIEMLSLHTFHPYEGGEGVLIREHVAAHLLFGLEKLASGAPEEALALFKQANEIPRHYNEGQRPVRGDHAHIDYCIGLAHLRLGNAEAAREHFRASALDQSASPEMGYYAACSLRRLGQEEEAQARAEKALADTDALWVTGGEYPYFTANLVTTQPFEHDIRLNNEAWCAYCCGLAHRAAGNAAEAEKWLQKALESKPTLYMASAMLAEIRK